MFYVRVAFGSQPDVADAVPLIKPKSFSTIIVFSYALTVCLTVVTDVGILIKVSK